MLGDLFFRVMVISQGVAYDLSDDLTSLTVEEDDEMSDKLTVVVPDPFRVFSYALQEGMQVEVDLGTIDDHSLVFRGLITKIEADFPDDGVPEVTLVAFDNSIRMCLRKRNRAWVDIDVAGIVAKIAEEYGFNLTEIDLPFGGNPTYEGNGMRQKEETDWAFLLRLAKEQRCKVFVEASEVGDVFTFKSERAIMQAEPTTTLHYGRCGAANALLRFAVKSDVTQRNRPEVLASIDPVTGRATDAVRRVDDVSALPSQPFDANLAELAQQHPVQAATLGGLINVAADAFNTIAADVIAEVRRIVPGLFNAETLREQAAPQADTAHNGWTGEGMTPGNKDLRAKRNVEIGDVGARFSGKWYVKQVRHVVDEDGYRTHFTCSR